MLGLRHASRLGETMNRSAVIGILWAASLVLAWFLGTNSGDEANQRQGRSTHPAKEPREPPAAPAEDGAAPREDPAPDPAPATEDTEEPAAPEKPFTTEGVEDVDELSKRFMEYFEQSLRKGEKGHLELYRTFDKITQDRSLRKFFRNDAQMARLAYPWLKFVMKHDRQVLAMTETVYKTAAENPSWFEGTDDDTLEILVNPERVPSLGLKYLALHQHPTVPSCDQLRASKVLGPNPNINSGPVFG